MAIRLPDQTLPSYLPQMKPGTAAKRGITPEKAIKTLRSNGIEVNEKEAEEILDFLYILAKLAVNQYVTETHGKEFSRSKLIQ